MNIPGFSSPSRKQSPYLNYLCSSLTWGQTLVILSATQGTRTGSLPAPHQLWDQALAPSKVRPQNTVRAFTEQPQSIHPCPFPHKEPYTGFGSLKTHIPYPHHSCPWHQLKPNGDKGRFSGQHKHLQKLISKVLASILSVKENNLTSLVY